MSRAGSREKKYRGVGFGRIGKTKIAILRTLTTAQVALHERTAAEATDEDIEMELDSEPGNSLLLLIPVPGRRKPHIWNITGMTHAELVATRQFFNFVFDRAEPIIRVRDKVAQDALSKGDDSYSRVYRALPQFIVRARQESSNSEGVLDGPQGSPRGDGGTGDSSRDLRTGRDVLADSQSNEGSSQDDRPETY